MAKQEGQVISGQVIEALPNTMFRVAFDSDVEAPGVITTETGAKQTIAYLSGKMKLYRIKVMVGDMVEILVDPYGGKGRIVKRK